jgi:hypothetical protein
MAMRKFKEFKILIKDRISNYKDRFLPQYKKLNCNNSNVNCNTNQNKKIDLNSFYLMKNLYKNNPETFMKINKMNFSKNNINQENIPVQSKKEKEQKAKFKDIKTFIFPLFKTKEAKKFLFYSFILTVGSKLLITCVKYKI